MVLSLKDKSLGTVLATIEGEAAVEDTEEPEVKKVTGKDKNTGTNTTGYVATSDLISYAHESVPIPKAFNGLEAAMVPTRLQYQFFEIEAVSEEDDCVVITATHVFYQLLQNQTYWMWEDRDSEKYVEYDVSAIINNIMARKMSADDRFSFATDSTEKEYGYNLDYGNKNIVEALLDPENGVCARFNLSLIRDNWNVYLIKNENVGTDRGFVVERGKNLLGVTREESIENTITRVAPIGRDTEGNIIWLSGDEWWVNSPTHLNDYSVPRCELLDTGIQITSEADAEKLRQEGRADEIVDWSNIMEKLWYAARDRFTVDHVDLPEVTMTIDFIGLGDTEEYKQYRNLDKVYLYDLITIKDEKRGYSYSAQVIGVEHDILTGMLTSATIGSLNGWDGIRKIATWQVPEVNGANIRFHSIAAGAFAPASITAEALMTGAVHWVHLNAASIDELTTEQLTALQANIHKLIAGTITAQDIAAHSITSDLLQAGSITTDLLAAGSVTADKIAAGEITADKLAAGAITAEKISATELEAIQSKLQIAVIASAEIGNADINYAKIKDLNAQSLFAGQAVFSESVGGKLFIERLAVGYGQMVSATIGDLVLRASDGKYYQIDVAMNGNVTGTEITPTPQEIENGYTASGRTIVETEITAQEINTSNIYATHALMGEITAAVINVDELFAREATIAKINAMDITSNTYLRAVIGDWDKGSTILQTIDSLNSRVSDLGHGQIYYSTTEPSHADLLPGDIWILPEADLSWSEISNFSWGDTTDVPWTEIAGLYKMYSWTGRMWRLLYDSNISVNLSTQIQQNREQIALKANETTVNTLSGQVSDFAAQLDVQAREIRSAVESVVNVTNTYVSWADPRDIYEVGLGDIWVKIPAEGFSTWGTLYNSEMTWGDLAETSRWKESIGDETYVWNGREWVLTADRASDVHYQTAFDQTDRHVQIMAQEQARIADQVYRNTSTVLITAEQIKQEVERAIAAEANRIEKTSRLQTADSIVEEAIRQTLDSTGARYLAKTTRYQTPDMIVSEAVQQSSSAAEGSYIKKTSDLQTADSIVTEAVHQAQENSGRVYLAKTTRYQTADSIVTEAVRQSGTAADGAYLKKTSSYQTADSIVTEAVRQSGTAAEGAYLKKTSSYQTAESIVTEAVSRSGTAADGAYLKKTSNYQTADSIVTEAVSRSSESAEGAYIKKTSNYQTADQILLKAQEYTDNNSYKIQSGVDIKAAGVEISGSKYIKILSGGTFEVASGNFSVNNTGGKIGGWDFSPSWIYTGSESTCLTLVGAERGADVSAYNWERVKDYAIYAGASWADEAPFRVKRDGTIYISKLVSLNADGTEQVVNLRSAGLWKLGYHTVKSYSNSSITLSNGDTINFNRAVDRVTLSGDPAATATILGINVWYSSDYYVTALLDVTSWKEKVQEATYWNIYRTAAGETVTVVVGGKTHTHFFAA